MTDAPKTDSELLALCEAATDGPWTYQENSDAYTHIVRAPGGLFMVQFRQDPSGQGEADARLTVAAREAIPRLLAEKARLERLVQWCRPRLAKDAYRETLDRMLSEPVEPDHTPVVLAEQGEA